MINQAILDAEKSVLTACLSEPEALMVAVDGLSADDFYDVRNSTIFREMGLMLSDGRPVEPILLSNSLRTSGVLQSCGGQDYIDDLHNDVFQIADAVSRVEFYIETVKRESVRRTLLNLTRKWVQTLKTSNPDEVLDSIQSDIINSLHPEGRSAPSRVFDIAAYVSKMIDKQSEGSYVSPAIPTGIHKLDDALGSGFYPGELIILAARPAVGKSALALQVALNMARAGKSVLLFSAEMSKEQNAQRIIAQSTNLGLMSLRLGALTKEERDRVKTATREFADCKLWIDDRAAITPAKIRTAARRLQARYGLDCIVVDYLQLLSGGGRFSNRVEEVSFISRCLKIVARDLGVPLLALSQLNRAAVGDMRPELHNLRESGSIEQDADTVMFIHPSKVDDRVKLIVAKQRQGPLGDINLRFNGDCTRFEE